MDDTSIDPPGGGLAVGRQAYRRLLSNRSFRNLVYAGFTSSLGDWIGVLAILALTESILGPTRAAAFALSGVMIARVLPTLILGPVAGVFVDRWDRKTLLIATDIGRGLVMLVVPFSSDILGLVLATLAIEVMSTLFIPAKDAAVPTLVAESELVHANQLNMGVGYGTLPIGGAAFAAMVGLTTRIFSDVEFLVDRPEAVPIWFNAATFFLSAFFIWRIPHIRNGRRTPTHAEEGPSTWEELKEGLAFIANRPLVRALVLGVMVAFLAAGAVVAVGELFSTVLNAGDSGFGVIVAVFGAGLFAGFLAAPPLSRRFALEQLFAPGVGTAGATVALAALAPSLPFALPAAFVVGLAGGLAFLTGYTMLQEHSSDEVRGRTFAAFNTGVRLALFTSLVIGPFLVGVIGPETRSVQPDGTFAYNYQLGGVRLTLVFAGLLALGSSVWTGRSIYHALSARPRSLDLHPADVPRGGRGLFVAFEGGEGAGKSTQVRLLRAAIERAGHDAIVTREPGGTPIGEAVRAILLDPRNHLMGDRAEALLYAAARAQHVDQVIRPALEKGQVVICDRFVDSSIIYQGVARGLGDDEVEELNRWGTSDLRPDLVVLLDVDPVEGLRRAGSSPDRLEQAGMDFHQRVNLAFRRRAQSDPDHYLVVDATLPAESIHAEVAAAVRDRLGVVA